MQQELLSLRSGEMSQEFANRLLLNPELIPEMIGQMEHKNPVIAWRAAWILDKLSESSPKVLVAYHPELVRILMQTPLNGIRRHLTKILGNCPSPACEDGQLVNCCLEWILLPKMPVAVKVNAMTLMLAISNTYPELKSELKIAIESGMEGATPGYKSRALKILKTL